MKITRKQFLKLAGGSLVGIAGVKVVGSALPGDEAEPKQKQWGLAIDFSKCRWDEGCEGCLSACKKAHNVPDIPDPNRAVKWTWKEHEPAVFPQQSALLPEAIKQRPVPVLCNHCAKPACTKVCPTAATWKREDGVVMMDWHRCIGCRYCMAACPYGARSFNWSDPRPHLVSINPDFPTRSKGVVEKCNLCEERLAKGQKPACVETCGEKAIVFGDLNDPESDIRRVLKARYSIQRRPELGTGPSVYYLI
jgi:[DsrC]-trisulfide reductase subunit O